MSDTIAAEPDLHKFGYAPGHYICICVSCEERHTADKRARRCQSCAMKAWEAHIDSMMSDTTPPWPDLEQNPGADTPMGNIDIIPTMKQRLARTAAGNYWDRIVAPMRIDRPTRDEYMEEDWSEFSDDVAAILQEMQSPSSELIDAMMRGFHVNEDPRQAMTDALVNGMAFLQNEGKS